MTSVLHDIKEDLDGMPAELRSHFKQVAADAGPALGDAAQEARSRGAALGATLVGHVPDQVIDRVPDAISDRLPGTTSGSGRKKWLIAGLLASAAAGVAVWMRAGSAPVPTGYPNATGDGHHTDRPTSMADETRDQTVNQKRP